MSDNRPKWFGLILAAGQSSRMGDRHKLLEDLNGRPVIRHVVEHASASHLDRILLVSGYRAAEVCVAAGTVESLYNPDYENGLSSSLKIGLAAIKEDCAGAFILLGDMPFVPADTIDRMIEAINTAPACVALVPVVEGEWAHPVVIKSELFAEIMSLSGDKGARAILKAHQDRVLLWPVNDRSLLIDLDTPDALQLARQTSDFSGVVFKNGE
jgi:molybdenum cofactor cytidylyltransferase